MRVKKTCDTQTYVFHGARQSSDFTSAVFSAAVMMGQPLRLASLPQKQQQCSLSKQLLRAWICPDAGEGCHLPIQPHCIHASPVTQNEQQSAAGAPGEPCIGENPESVPTPSCKPRKLARAPAPELAPYPRHDHLPCRASHVLHASVSSAAGQPAASRPQLGAPRPQNPLPPF